MGLMTTKIPYRTANFAHRAKMRTNYCSATDATKAITHTVSNRKWRKFPKVIGELINAVCTHSVLKNRNVEKLRVPLHIYFVTGIALSV